VSILQGVEFWHSPLTKAVAVNTVLRYRAPVTRLLCQMDSILLDT